MKVDESSLNAAIEQTLERAGKSFTELGSLPALLRAADKELTDRLRKAAKRNGGEEARFTEASAELYRKQIRLVQKYLNQRMLGLTHEQAKHEVRRTMANTVKLASGLEARFQGITRPLPIDTSQWMDNAVRGTNSSLLRQHKTSVDRYGTRMIADFERQIRLGLMTGMSQHEIVSRLVEQGGKARIDAERLHKRDPKWFPEPTSYVKRRYWAERIVRTEMAYAHNAAAYQGMVEMRSHQFPDMGKKILAVMDQRTALDSVGVHGQVRKLDEMFLDGAGRQYLFPPARPNDRETIIPWRLGWKELPATKPEPQQEPPKPPPAPPEGTPEASPNTILGRILEANTKAQQRKAEIRQANEEQAAQAKAQGEAAAKAKAIEAAANAAVKRSVSRPEPKAKPRPRARSIDELAARRKATAELQEVERKRVVDQVNRLGGAKAARTSDAGVFATPERRDAVLAAFGGLTPKQATLVATGKADVASTTEYSKAIARGSKRLPPIEIYVIEPLSGQTETRLSDGRHRLRAAAMAGATEIRANLVHEKETRPGRWKVTTHKEQVIKVDTQKEQEKKETIREERAKAKEKVRKARDPFKGMVGTAAEMTPEYRFKAGHPVWSDLTKLWGEGNVPHPKAFEKMFALPKGYTYDRIRMTDEDGEFSWSATIRKNGKFVGQVDRSFYRVETPGKPPHVRVSHDLLSLEGPYKGSAIGGSILAHSNKWYERLGVKEVTLAAVDDGRTAWAHFGFDWRNDIVKNRHLAQFQASLENRQGMTSEQAAAIVKTIKHPRDLLNFELNAPEVKPARKKPNQVFEWEVGRRFLLEDGGPAWAARLMLDENNEGYRIYKQRLANAERKLRERGEWKE